MSAPVELGPAHADLLAALHACAFPPGERWSAASFATLLSAPVPAWGFAHEDASAMALFRSVGNETELLSIASIPSRRRQGLAGGLLAAGIARIARPATLFLEVERTNAPAVGLYRRHGFAPVGARPDYYGPGRPALLMRLPLDADGSGERFRTTSLSAPSASRSEPTTA